MIKVSVLYPRTEGMRFDMSYYAEHHMGLVKRLAGDVLLRYEIDEGLSGPAPGSVPPFHAAVHMYFESLESFQTGFGPHAKTLSADVPNYTDVTPVMQISTVREG